MNATNCLYRRRSEARMAGVVFKVMLSSTYRDLIEHREAVRDAILGQRMLPLIMETDSANPSRGIITSSLAMVDDADAYVVLISNYRYGQVIDDPVLNPDGPFRSRSWNSAVPRRAICRCASS